MKKILFPFLMAGLLLGLVATAMRPVAAEPTTILASTTLNPSLDTTLFEESGDLSNGRGQHIFVGNTGPINSNNARRALIAFDVAGSIPAGATILTATLRLNLSRVNGGEAGNARAIALHPATAAWGEGTSDASGQEGTGADATAGDATWSHNNYTSTAWTTPGGDFVGTASATQMVTGLGAYTWQSAGMAADVQSWLDAPASNFGWLLLGNEVTSLTARRFDSQQHGTAANRPQLIIEYLLPVAPAEIALTGPLTGTTSTSIPFTAAVLPISTTLPITYTWEAAEQLPVTHASSNSLSDNIAFTWVTTGTKLVTVTADNGLGVVSDTLTIEIEDAPPTPLDSVTISGATSGDILVGYTFTATAAPLSTTVPITYTWEADEQLPVTHANSNSLSDNIDFTWATAGAKLVTITADNGFGVVSDTLTIEIEEAPPTPLESVAISGPTSGDVLEVYTFTATAVPLSATLPITYSWWADGQTASEHVSASLTDAISYTWNMVGAKVITVTADNGSSTATDTFGITIGTEGQITLWPLKDNTLYENGTGSLSNGAGQYFFVGNNSGGNSRRGLLAFDVAGSVPAGAQIVSATLILNLSRASVPTATAVSLYPLTADWGEGTSDASGEEGGGAPAQANDATWLHRFYTETLWITPGGDFETTASASQMTGEEGTYLWSSAELVADVQSWLDASTANFGWLLQADETLNNTAKRFDTRENPVEGNRPVLLVAYEMGGGSTAVYLPLVVK
ncbi:MAG: DNRLRE domain-containing protein [Chloroflexi bacterium]|nr:DNRLRE domain-containing protein [Chloroflexota bacterium]